MTRNTESRLLGDVSDGYGPAGAGPLGAKFGQDRTFRMHAAIERMRIRMRFPSLVLFALFQLFSPVAMSQDSVMPEVVSTSANGHVDIQFSILEHRPVEHEGKHIGDALLIGGMWDGEAVRISVLIPSEWDQANLTPAPPAKSWSTPISFLRVGVSSDRLVKALAKRYKVPDVGLQAREEVELDALSLFDDPRPFGSKPIRLKLFLVRNGVLAGGEIYLAIDFQRKVVELNEKSPEYRAAVIKALAAQR